MTRGKHRRCQREKAAINAIVILVVMVISPRRGANRFCRPDWGRASFIPGFALERNLLGYVRASLHDGHKQLAAI
jgi:hypothetical protein